MIHESYYWKKELYNYYQIIAKYRINKRDSEQLFAKVEKAILIGAFIIRKLNDAEKLPPSMLGEKTIIGKSKHRDTIVDHMNWHHIDKHYSTDEIIEEEHDWMFLINQLIHSFALSFVFNDNDLFDGILINSDYSKQKSLYFFPFKSIITLFLTISEGTITRSNSMREIKGFDECGKPILGEMKLKEAIYSYPNNFNIEETVNDTLKGKLYLRSNIIV